MRRDGSGSPSRDRRGSGRRSDRHRRTPAEGPLVPILAGALAAIVLLLLGVPLLARAVRRSSAPAAARGAVSTAKASGVRLAATPPDASLRLGPHSATGTLALASLAPGTYTLVANRAGFAPLTVPVVVKAGASVVATYPLKPLPQALKLTSHQKGARFTVAAADGRKLTRPTTLSAELPSGDTVVTLTAPGYPVWRKELFLDSPTSLDVWLDPLGQLVHTVSVFKCVPAPKGVAVTPDGSQMWVTALVTQPSIEAYDRSGKVLGKVDLGKSGAVEVVFNADGSRAYASQMQSASVFEIDTKTFKVLRQLKTNSSWTKIVALSPDEKKLYAANWSGDDISEIDLASGKCTRRFPTVDTPRGLWPTADGKRLFVAGFGEQSLVGRIAVIDLATGKSRTIFTEKGGAMRHMVADERRGLVFTSDMGKACVWVTDMRTLKTKRFVKVDSHPNTMDLSPDGKVLVVSCRGANNPKSYYIPGPEWGSVELFDATTGKPLDAIIGGNQCTALDLSSDGKTLVFSDFLDDRLHVYDIPDYATLVAGKGGRYAAHFRQIRKPGWSSSGNGSASGAGD